MHQFIYTFTYYCRLTAWKAELGRLLPSSGNYKKAALDIHVQVLCGYKPPVAKYQGE